MSFYLYVILYCLFSTPVPLFFPFPKWQQIEQLRAQGIHLDLNSGLDATSAASDVARRYCPSAKELFEAKIQRLKLLRPDEVFVKRSREHQLLSTVMYGYGRDLALEFMEENRKILEEREKASQESDKGSSASSSKKPPALLSKANFFHKKYENFVLQFPELTGFKTKIKRSKNQIVSARNYIQNIAQKAFYKNVKKEEDKEQLVKKAAEESGKMNGGGGGGKGGGGGSGSVSGENGGFGSECSNHSMPSPEPKVEPAEPLINPHTGLPDPDYDPYDDDDDDDDDIIFLWDGSL